MSRPVKLMLVILSTVLVLVGAGVGTYLYLKSANHTSRSTSVLTPAQRRALQVDIPSMTTNTGDDGGLIQLSITVQASDASTQKEINDLLPVIQDEVLRTVHHFSAAELRAPDGQGKLGGKIQAGINQLLAKGQVTAVLFTQWIVQ